MMLRVVLAFDEPNRRIHFLLEQFAEGDKLYLVNNFPDHLIGY
jgi:hypothetical protein